MKNNLNINLAGIWIPSNSNQISTYFNGSISSPFQGLLRIGTSDKYSLLVTGWNATGLDPNGNNVIINIGLFTPDNNGNLYLTTTQYISDPSTYGAGSVVITDFNGDGLDDIFLAAHSEAPMLPTSSTAYIQNNNGTFNKIAINDQLVAHDAKLIYINNKPLVLTTTFDATDQKTFSSANPIYYFDNSGFKPLFPNLSWHDLAYLGDESKTWLANIGMSSVIDTFGTNNQLKLIRSDNNKYSSDWSKLISFDISVYNFDPVSGLSTSAEQRITPFLSTLEKYKNYNSLWGSGITHTYRLWSDDLNHDGHPDIIAAESMWNPQSNDWPNALQLLINDGTGHFSDQTIKLNPDMSLNTEEFSYTPLFIDLDHSGINSYIFTNHANLGYERQTNYVLLNDGTGRIYIALHDEFLKYANLISDYLLNNSEVIKNYNIYDYPNGNTISFIPNPQPDGSINFLAQINSTKKDSLNQAAYVFVNFDLAYNPAVDFIENITVSDRNQSKLMRTWAGNDIFKDTNSSLNTTHIDGGKGFDLSIYSQNSKSYKLNFNANGSTEVVGSDISDSLINVEKLQFTDRSVIIESKSHGSYADLPTELYQFFITAFDAAPGVTYMDQLAEAYRYGLSVKQIVDIFTTKKQFTDVYSPSLSHQDMATQLVNNIVKNSATSSAKSEAVSDIKGALDLGWTVGDVIYTVFGNLAHKSPTDPVWGNTGKQFNNEIAVAKYYTEILNQSTTDLETLRDVIQPVTQSTDVSSDAVVAQLVGVALLSGGLGP